MTLSSLFIVCSHGRRSAHGISPTGDPAVMSWQVDSWCPGGRPATLEDLGGEKVWWCSTHKSSAEPVTTEHYDTGETVVVEGLAPYDCDLAMYDDRSGPCEITERILIPLPQMVAGESL